MSTLLLNSREYEFVMQQRDLFLTEALKLFGASAVGQLPPITRRKPIALRPTIVKDYRALTNQEIEAIATGFYGESGVAYFVVENPELVGTKVHPLTEIAAQLSNVLPLKYPVNHPMEGHQEAVSRFGAPDGTLKIYNLDTKDGTSGYREQAETSEMFDSHNDGLGYAGAVHAFMLYADGGPVWGGFTYFLNVVRLSLDLAASDIEAFTSLFLPDAITVLRPRGKGAIKVVSPVLFMNELERPQCFLRLRTGEYQITWRHGCDALSRAAEFLNNHAEPFAYGSAFVNLDRKGAGIIVQNELNVHGRTPFEDNQMQGRRRVLARKWFMSEARHAKYKHVPGIHILRRFADIYPEQFGASQLEGDWNYDPKVGENVRKH
jgi:hypothetical protein